MKTIKQFFEGSKMYIQPKLYQQVNNKTLPRNKTLLKNNSRHF